MNNASSHQNNVIRQNTCKLIPNYVFVFRNMERPVTFWYMKDQPTFENNDDFESNIEVTRISAGADSPPGLKISSKMFEACEKANWEFMRMSLPVICNSTFIE